MKKSNLRTKDLIEKIRKVADEIGKKTTLMEVCGTHTRAASRFGIRKLLPPNVKLVSGPGCPVCVTDQVDIDAIVWLALAGVPVATYGDMLRVRGYLGSLESARSQGAEVFAVYSAEEVIALKEEKPDIVFFGLGFDTTAPMTAVALAAGVAVYSTHKLFLPAMDALLAMGEIKIDGFISPGHVSTIVGIDAYRHMDVAQVIAGFEAEDVLVGIYILLEMIRDGKKEVVNEYARLVRPQGNEKAREILFGNFRITDGHWRGFGIIPDSGLEVKDDKLNAKIIHGDILATMDLSKSKKPTGCLCDRVIRGLIEPRDCPMFGKSCTPENPYGPCMVSEEGICNTTFRYM